MSAEITLREATASDAREIAELHLSARRTAMPYLRQPFTDDETRGWFSREIVAPSTAWWVARHDDLTVGYMLLFRDDLDHLYVLPGWQRRGIGSRLLNHAKALSPRRLQLYAFQRNIGARAFYEAHGFRLVKLRDGSHNIEEEPDVEYEWRGSAP